MNSGFVALIGWTNVGKSTLLNRMIGTKVAAVADRAQTTRTRITGARTETRGQILFVDTPGLHRPRHRMNRTMVEIAESTALGADVVVQLIDASRPIGAGDLEVTARLLAARPPLVVALNKVDRVQPKERLLEMIQRLVDAGVEGDIVPISALDGEGCDRLLEVLYRTLPAGEPLYPEDYLTDQPLRVIVGEWIRERLLEATHEELPHVSAVLVERWEEREDGLLEIGAQIVVERDSHKKIVIGKGGSRIKQIGSEARRALEPYLERRLYLDLFVKVRADWRNDETLLRELGLGGG